MQLRNLKQVVLSAIIYTIMAQVINIVGTIFTMSYYTDPANFRLWSRLMMPGNGPPGTEFFVASIAIGFLVGMIFAGAYSFLKGSIPGKGFTKGINFGLLLYLVSGVPFTLTTYLLLAVPALLLLDWAVSSLVIYLIIGAAFAKIIVD
ncbi:MAG: hypothetical protein O8C66_15230 [Candidatus Methanoperedens sp.]|nr:hypothetical protein [Candidatus Methanoperedens sp.]MCZ7371853.1 hypothetical protein [Candidatus Methanoperedens sp.]